MGKTQLEQFRMLAEQEKAEREKKNKEWEEKTIKDGMEVFGMDEDEFEFLDFLYSASYDDDDEEDEEEDCYDDWEEGLKGHVDWYEYNGVSRSDFL